VRAHADCDSDAAMSKSSGGAGLGAWRHANFARILSWRPFGFCVALGLAACAVGPDFEPPPPPAVARFTKEQTASPGAGQQFQENGEIPERWWREFGSPQLDGLVEEALQRNATIEAAQAALRVAHFDAGAAAGGLFPALGFSTNSSRNLFSVDATNSTVTQSTFSYFTQQLQVSYALDVWGGTRRGVEALEAQVEGKVHLLRAAKVMLTAHVVKAAIEEASLNEQIAATQHLVGIEGERLTLLEIQRANGALAPIEVLAQEAALAQVRQRLPALQNLLAAQRNLLTALAGRLPSDEVEPHFSLAQFSLPQELPLTLPARLVAQRPDIKLAEADLHAASAQVGVAIAARLPNIQLSAAGQTGAFEFSQLFHAGTYGYQIAGNAAMTIFDGMSLRNQQRAAEARLDQARAEYRDTVIRAFQDVSNCLRALQADARSVEAARAAEEAAQRYMAKARLQKNLGGTSGLMVLDAQRAYLGASLARAQAEALRLSNTVALFAALGGGWRCAAEGPGDSTVGGAPQGKSC
jgi:NodT family efflux transporter outer membrane factor (OMF) lipoprotein